MARSVGPSGDEVATFLAAAKSIDTAHGMEWKVFPGADRAVRWRAPVEVEGILSADVMLYYNYAVEGWWNYHLALRGHRVFGWHFKPGGKHTNRRGCGSDFPRKAKTPHEAHWLVGHGLACCKPLEGVDPLDHEAGFHGFCARTNLTSNFAYSKPEVREQLQAFTPEDFG